ncbi:hypothetical protein ACWDUL_21005 [Nocardia niigatensis]
MPKSNLIVDQNDNPDAVLGAYRAGQDDAAPLAEVRFYRCDNDGALVVQLDTTVDTGPVRIYLNDAVVYDADPDLP